METLDLRQDIPRDPIGQILTYEEGSIALVDLGRNASDALRASWSTARPFRSGGVIDSAWLLPMLGVGSAATSSLFAGNVFLATANPATLMTIGAGVGSAVMGPTGIVATAPFVAATGALIPVVAPVVLFTTISSVMMSARLDRVQTTLGRLFDVVEHVRRLLLAEDYAKFEVAAERIEEIRSEFEDCQRFASDVPVRLSAVADHVSELRSKYRLLGTEDIHSEEDARSAVLSLSRFFLASLYDIQVDLLRLNLALQNDPDVVKSREPELRKKIAQYSKDFRQLLDNDPVGVFHRKLKGDLPKSRWSYLPRAWRRRFGGELATTVRNVREIRKDFRSVQTGIRKWTEAFETAAAESHQQSIVFYREPDGARTLRAYHTGDVRLERADS